MRRSPWINLVLFVLTLCSTMIVGAMQAGVDIFSEPVRIYRGLPFSLTLLTILLAHEFSHYIASRMHGVEASLPYFIPAPTLFGTLGAFIAMRSRITTKNALLDIGASGPLAGFIISVIAVMAGLAYSDLIVPQAGKEVIELGDSILFRALSKIVIGNVPDSAEIYLHPVAFAGWIGLFVTSLNLIPVGQLDGGHIAYAVFGAMHERFSKVLIGIMVVFGIFLFTGWLVWAVLLIFLGLKHPPIYYPEIPLDPRRRTVALIALVIFVITFIPVPVTIK